MNNKNNISHPSFGMISLHRSNSGVGPYFFGTDMRPNSYITLRISMNSSFEYNDITGRRTYPSNQIEDKVAEVIMTNTQFADMITSIGIGEGTPCTITKANGEYIQQFTGTAETMFGHEYNSVINSIKSLTDAHKSAEKEISILIQKLPKKNQEEVMSILRRLRMEIDDNIPFHLRKVEEVTEKLTARAKGEIAAYTSLAKNSIAGVIERRPENVPFSLELKMDDQNNG